jgi:hypothetical protein
MQIRLTLPMITLAVALTAMACAAGSGTTAAKPSESLPTDSPTESGPTTTDAPTINVSPPPTGFKFAGTTRTFVDQAGYKASITYDFNTTTPILDPTQSAPGKTSLSFSAIGTITVNNLTAEHQLPVLDSFNLALFAVYRKTRPICRAFGATAPYCKLRLGYTSGQGGVISPGGTLDLPFADPPQDLKQLSETSASAALADLKRRPDGFRLQTVHDNQLAINGQTIRNPICELQTMYFTLDTLAISPSVACSAVDFEG